MHADGGWQSMEGVPNKNVTKIKDMSLNNPRPES